MNFRGLLLGVALAGWVGTTASWAAGPAAPVQGAALLKTDVMGVFAHPDDETGVAPLIARLALGEGRVVTHVYCTRGEGGGNMVGTQAGAALGVLREAELRDCLARLGVRHCRFLDREDFAYTESLGVTLEKWGHEETLERLVRLVRAFRPEVVVTMNPAPTPGQHGNHQAAGWLAVEAFDAAADPERFPDQVRHDGLHPWQVRKLYFGGVGPYLATVTTTNALPDGRTPVQVAGEALANHRSQAFGNMAASPWLRRPQVLQLVKSVVPFSANETSLFNGLPVGGDLPPRLLPPDAAKTGLDSLRFLPRVAVSRYERWVRSERIAPAATSFAPDVPVVAGEETAVPLEIPAALAGARPTVTFRVADGWKVSPERLSPDEARPPGPDYRLLKVRAPEGGGDAELEAVARTASGETVARVRLHPVPHTRIPRAGRVPRLDDPVDDPAWASLGSIAIAHTNVWEGAVKDAADSSASVRLGHDGERLYVEVRVRDDVVVSNIEPDDIRGHWRSDSVELCIGPVVGAEHTLGTFKAGIFPFDRAGKVRAARDADANPGVVEETAPGMRLASQRLPDGYLVRAEVPLALVKVDLAKSRRIALNVLVYDGDKRDAAPGENINKSRLAWAPRSGVQGRPEDWGQADLE